MAEFGKIRNRVKHNNLDRNCMVESPMSGPNNVTGMVDRNSLALHMYSAVATNMARIEGDCEIVKQSLHLNAVVPTTLTTRIFT